MSREKPRRTWREIEANNKKWHDRGQLGRRVLEGTFLASAAALLGYGGWTIVKTLDLPTSETDVRLAQMQRALTGDPDTGVAISPGEYIDTLSPENLALAFAFLIIGSVIVQRLYSASRYWGRERQENKGRFDYL
ncbi:MAG: hypothetical protein ACE5F4_00185, partial [Candidatus Paceibacteria bacterium]